MDRVNELRKRATNDITKIDTEEIPIIKNTLQLQDIYTKTDHTHILAKHARSLKKLKC